MQNIINQLIHCLEDGNLKLKKQPDYLDLRSGKFNCKAGFALTTDQLYAKPSIILEESLAPQYDLASSSVYTKFDFSEVMETQRPSIDQQICQHITEISIHEASLKLFENEKGELREVQNKLAQLVQNDRMNINSYSKNTMTNCCSYNIMGEVEDIHTISIDAASKKYIQEDLLEHAPHPVRSNSKRRIIQKQPDRKDKTQLLEQFQILNSLFTLGVDKEQENVPFQDVLDVVSFKDDADYNDLWEEIISQLSIDREKIVNFPKKKKQNEKQIDDKEFIKTVERIISEAQQYTEEIIEAVQEQIQEKEQELQIQVKKEEELVSELAQISVTEKKTSQIKNNKHYQFAIEDNTDISTFYDTLPKQKFAKQYEFQLDEFQKRSILHLEKKESVFVAAHTSAGKTVVAQYGIALALKHKRKVIYTSPIKALSNQKYRELSRAFDSVGIVTGDVTMNPQASCVIMTTEILRNNLYRGAQMIRDIEWVIFDEVHYINNPERGVVWEETIIMLPQHIGLIMLSATVPNYMDFANWVGRTKHRTIFVMKTLHRPVPLEHSLYIFGKLRVIKQPNGRFLKEQYNQLKHHINSLARGAQDKKAQMKELKKKKIEQKGFYNDNRRQQRVKLMTKNAIDKFIKKITKGDLENADGKQDFRILEQLIDHCNKNKLLPCVVFTFSKKKINALAEKIFSFDLTNRHQKSKIMQLISHALSTLKPEDRELHQFKFLTQICLNGYAIHHGDLLPLAKQLVQLLFSEGLIKVLFATQTFAMGINMPTKTVIYHSIRKVAGSDGSQRFLNSSEYVQMSGRAGRRGLDQKGNVIIIVKQPNNLPDSEQMVKMMDYPGEHLTSKFKVTYQIILNLYNSKDINVQEMMRQSFMEDPKFKEYTTNIKKTKQLKTQFQELSFYQCEFNKLNTRMIMEQYTVAAQTLRGGNQYRFWRNDLNKFKLPRLALLLGHNNETQLCLILKIQKTNYDRVIQVMVVNKIYRDLQINKQERQREQAKLGIKKKIILQFQNNRTSNIKEFNGAVEGRNNEYFYYVYWVTPKEILEVYRDKLKSSIHLDQSKKSYAQIANQLLTANKVLTPINNELKEENIYNNFINFQCHNCKLKDTHMQQQRNRAKAKMEMQITSSRINKNQLGLMGSFEGMVKLLESFKFVNENSLTLKGRVAREVDIYVAQIIVEAVLDPLSYAEIAALLSAFVCDFKPRPSRGQDIHANSPFSREDTYTDNLETAIQRTHQIVSKIVQYQINNQAYYNPLPEQELLISIINFHLVDTVYKWADGFDFIEAKQDTKAPEGTIVRTIMRLNMLLGNVKSVCRLLGSSDLEKKIDQAIQSIKRDIVFCQSLYLST